MTKPSLPSPATAKAAKAMKPSLSSNSMNRRVRRKKNNEDVLVSAVISTYLLTHLHHVLQRAEYGATKEGRLIQASNFAQLRKVLCMDARSMKDASAEGMLDIDSNKRHESQLTSKVA